jgi:hypothetical protein
MSAQGPVPATRPLKRVRAGFALAALAAGSCSSTPPAHVVVHETAPDAAHVAAVRLEPCGVAWCESLWIGSNLDTATRIVTLPGGEERCDEIVWTRDGKRVAFLINGYQLRLYDARTHAPSGLVDLVPADARPTTRVARGLTFSDNGAAITFDDCPRNRSGCRPGMLAIVVK